MPFRTAFLITHELILSNGNSNKWLNRHLSIFLAEQFEQAVSDFTKCLELQQQNLTEEDRRIAETFYQLGLAYTMNREYNSAIESCLNAIRVMEARGKLLKRAVAGEISSDVVKPTDGFYTPLELAEKEIEELAGLISDIHAKVMRT